MSVSLDFQRQGTDLRIRRSIDPTEGYQVLGSIRVTEAEAAHVLSAGYEAARMLFDAAWQEPAHVSESVTTGDQVVNRLVRKIVAAAAAVTAPRPERKALVQAAC